MTTFTSRTGMVDESEGILGELAEDLLARLRSGQSVDVETFLAAHPEQADSLRRLLPTIRMMVELGRSAVRADGIQGGEDAGIGLGELGDYRILREVGRGGMGIVYEARQLSLNRRVALKVLPMAAALDPRQLQRFRNEAQAAAGLHHTNIVPVFSVGCERGVHYYAMQFIEGRALSEIIRELRRLNRPSAQGQIRHVETPVEASATAEVVGAVPASPPAGPLSSGSSISNRPPVVARHRRFQWRPQARPGGAQPLLRRGERAPEQRERHIQSGDPHRDHHRHPL
jgi:hypothetical protein